LIEGKGTFGGLTVSKGRAHPRFAKNLPTSCGRCVFFDKNLDRPAPFPIKPSKQKTTDATDDAEVKKMSLIMVNNEKILKQKNSLRSGINISIRLILAVLAAVAGLMWGFGSVISAAVGIWLGYRVLRLVFRLAGLLLRLVFVLVSIVILSIIISLLIF
jgi:hypothetical protein